MRMMGNGLTVVGALLLILFHVWPVVGQASTTGAHSRTSTNRSAFTSSLEFFSRRGPWSRIAFFLLGFCSLSAICHRVCLCRIGMRTHGRGQRRTPRRRERDVACHRRSLRRTRHSANHRLCRRRRRHLAGRVADDSTTVANRDAT